MIYLSGGVPRSLRENPHPSIGWMTSPDKTNRGHCGRMAWAADNGCFAQGDRFDAERWLRWLASLAPFAPRCLFAVAPDVVGDAAATLARSAPHLPTIRRLGFGAAFVTQDGCHSDLVPWDALDCLFVGGTDAWKLGERSYALCAEAKARGKWVHMGRVNSLRRLRACRVSLVDSADGTQLAHRPDETLPLLRRWLDALAAQTVLGT